MVNFARKHVGINDLLPKTIHQLTWLRAKSVSLTKLSIVDQTRMGVNSIHYSLLELFVIPTECDRQPDGNFAKLLKILLAERLWEGRWDMPSMRPVALQATGAGALLCTHVNADVIMSGIERLGRKVGFHATYGGIVKKIEDREERGAKYLAQGRTWYGDDQEPELPEPDSGPKIEWKIEKEADKEGKGQIKSKQEPEPLQILAASPVEEDGSASETDLKEFSEGESELSKTGVTEAKSGLSDDGQKPEEGTEDDWVLV